jgi:UDPglucose 6-dehydrogenase
VIPKQGSPFIHEKELTRMNITIIGTGYVGLSTGVCLAQLGHNVIGVDINEERISMLQKGQSPIYEPGLEDMLKANLKENRLNFTTDYTYACSDPDSIILSVGTPNHPDGSANLSYLKSAAESIATHLKKPNTLMVVKSTVPVGTGRQVTQWIQEALPAPLPLEVISNPEFLREGSAIEDMFEPDRIIIGTHTEEAFHRMTTMYKGIEAPILHTSVESAELIKYASNAFLATKISFINEIANLCEKLEANVEDVAKGMGMDKRIGPQFLKAGIGYGGSCFPKDTNALVQIAGNIEHEFELLQSVIKVNAKQQVKLIDKAKQRFNSLEGKKAALFGLSFKPNTDDIREAASIEMIIELLQEGAKVTVYDPVATPHVKKIFGDQLIYADSPLQAVEGQDMAFIVTEWEEIRVLRLQTMASLMDTPVLFDGRNCFSLQEAKGTAIDYYSIGRPSVINIENKQKK